MQKNQGLVDRPYWYMCCIGLCPYMLSHLVWCGEVLSFLKTVKLFSGFPKEEAEVCAKAFTLEKFSPGNYPLVC